MGKPHALASRLPVGAYLMSINDIDVTHLWLDELSSLVNALAGRDDASGSGSGSGSGGAGPPKWSVKFRF
jgi:hypothetical protein